MSDIKVIIKKSGLYRKAKRVYNRFRLRVYFPGIYKKYAKGPVDRKKVVFILVRAEGVSGNIRMLYDRLKKEGYRIYLHHLHMNSESLWKYHGRCAFMTRDVATAGYVFIDDASDVFAALPVRKETVVTQLWHACGAFKRFGMSMANREDSCDKKTLEEFPFHGNYTHVTVSAPEVVRAYEEAMSLTKRPGVVKPVGVSRTDYFFEEGRRERALRHLYMVFPAAKEKKVILYAPTFRGRADCTKTEDRINVNRFQSALSKDYVFLFKRHPFMKKEVYVPESCRSFAADVTTDLPIEELLLCADVLVTDYSSVVFEYALLERPVIFYAYDLDEYYDRRGFYYPYEDFVPGPVARSEEELLAQLREENCGADIEKIKRFKEKFMSACDGHATDRIIDMVFGNQKTNNGEKNV